MPQFTVKSPIKIIINKKRTFSLGELLEMIEGRKMQVLSVANKITFSSAGSEKLDATCVQTSTTVHHTVFDDKPRVIAGPTCYLGLETQGLFDWSYSSEILSTERNNFQRKGYGWGITRKGKWVSVHLLRRIRDIPERGLASYHEAMEVSIMQTSLPELIEILRPTGRFDYETTLGI